MLITTSFFSQVAGRAVSVNMASALAGLKYGGVGAGLDLPHRFAMFIAQTAHESMGWVHDREIWGPTAAQRRYEGRKDLGNIYPGDGALFRGYTPMQLTGRYNTTKFYNWCVKTFPHLSVPDFTVQPHLMNTDPWEGIGPIWYWTNGKSKSLNVQADLGNFREVTRLVNGGYNGLDDRYRYYARAGLVLLGRPADGLKQLQAEHGLKADGICGPKTASLIHELLVKLPKIRFNEVEPAKSPTTTGLWSAIVSLLKSLGIMK